MSMMQHIAPASAGTMLLRAARNILGSPLIAPDGEPYPLCDRQAATYASHCVKFLAGERRILPLLLNNLSSFPLDWGLVMRDILVPNLDPDHRSQVAAICDAALIAEETRTSAVHRRSENYVTIKHFVGMVFSHLRHDYIGCIRGWEVIMATFTAEFLS